MTGISQWLTRLGQTNYAQFIGNSSKMITFCVKEAELSLLTGSRGGKRVFYDARQHRISHDKSAHSSTLELMGEQTEGIGITLKVGDVVPELMTDLTLQVTAWPFREVGLDGLFATMTKGGITHVVCQTGRGHDLSDL